jgi:hypothetical protein
LTKRLEKEGSQVSLHDCLSEAFSLFDADGSGALDVNELNDALKMLGLNIPFDTVQEMINEIDDSGDGEIDYQELITAIVGSDAKEATVPEEFEKEEEAALDTKKKEPRDGKQLWKQTRSVIQATNQFKKVLSGAQLVDMMKQSNTGDEFDLVVLGAGPAGVKAAVECANKGFRVSLVDPKATITGAPTGAHSKCLREAVLEGAKSWPEVEAVINKVVPRAEQSTAELLRSFHVELMKGAGSFVDQETILFTPVNGEPISRLIAW